jgi:hypothetical protein
MDPDNTATAMTAANVDDVSAPVDIEDSNNQQNGEAEPIPAT